MADDDFTRSIAVADNFIPQEGRPLDKQLERIQKQYHRRLAAQEATYLTSVHAMERSADIHLYGTEQFARGADGMAEIAEREHRPMAEGPIVQHAKNEIDALSRHIRATADAGIHTIVQSAVKAFPTEPPKKRGLFGRRED